MMKLFYIYNTPKMFMLKGPFYFLRCSPKKKREVSSHIIL